MAISPLIAGSLTGVFLVTPAPDVSPTLSDRAPWVKLANAALPAGTRRDEMNLPQSKVSAWRSSLAKNAHSLSSLAAGWDGPGSAPISSNVISRAVFFAETALTPLDMSCDIAPPHLVPGGDGSAQIEWHTKRGQLELDIGVNGELSVWIRDRLNGVEFDGEGEKALTLFYRWAPWVASRDRDASNVLPQTQVDIGAVAA